jgi:hypothetical protein
MTQDEIIKMARQAGVDKWWDSGNEQREVLQKHLVVFAKLVAAKEREKIHKAKECCILCEQKGVCNENTKDDETNTAKILGES